MAPNPPDHVELYEDQHLSLAEIGAGFGHTAGWVRSVLDHGLRVAGIAKELGVTDYGVLDPHAGQVGQDRPADPGDRPGTHRPHPRWTACGSCVAGPFERDGRTCGLVPVARLADGLRLYFEAERAGGANDRRQWHTAGRRRSTFAHYIRAVRGLTNPARGSGFARCSPGHWVLRAVRSGRSPAAAAPTETTRSREID